MLPSAKMKRFGQRVVGVALAVVSRRAALALASRHGVLGGKALTRGLSPRHSSLEARTPASLPRRIRIPRMEHRPHPPETPPTSPPSSLRPRHLRRSTTFVTNRCPRIAPALARTSVPSTNRPISPTSRSKAAFLIASAPWVVLQAPMVAVPTPGSRPLW